MYELVGRERGEDAVNIGNGYSGYIVGASRLNRTVMYFRHI